MYLRNLLELFQSFPKSDHIQCLQGTNQFSSKHVVFTTRTYPVVVEELETTVTALVQT